MTMSDPAQDEQDRLDMRRLAEGHDAALNDLIARHGERLFHYLLRQLPGESEASDVAQETFVKVYLNRTKFRAESKFTTWLYVIATNLVRTHYRWKARHPEVSLEAREEEHQSLGEALPDPTSSPSEVLMAQERSEQVRKAVQSLPEELRTPLILVEYESLSQMEIADILGCTRKTVEMRLYRARQALREKLLKVMAE